MADFTKEEVLALASVVAPTSGYRSVIVSPKNASIIAELLRAYAEAMSAVPVAWQESLYDQPWRHVETWHAQAAQVKMAAGEDMGNIRFRPLYAAPPVSAPAEPVAVSSRLIEAAKAVEAWWLEVGMKRFTGAPYAMFALRSALVSPPAPVAEVGAAVPDLEEAIRLAEVGEYLFSAKAYSYGDGHTEPREYGIEWQWQQSAPNTFGQGILLAEATAWHEQMAADGIVTEASKLRAVLAAAPLPPTAKAPAEPCKLCGAEAASNPMSDICERCEAEAPWRDHSRPPPPAREIGEANDG